MITHTNIRTENLIDIGDVRAPVGTPAWCKAVYFELRRLKQDGERAVIGLKYKLIDFQDNQYFRKVADRDGRLFAVWEDFVQYPEPFGLGMRVDVANAIMREPNEHRLLREVLESVPPLAKHGSNQHTDGGRVHSTSTRGSTNAAYLVARLKRDHPEIVTRLAAGEFKSVRAAARAAGIKVDTPPLIILRRAWKKATPDERAAFLAEINTTMEQTNGR